MRFERAAPTGRLLMRLRKIAPLLALLPLAAAPLIAGSRSEAVFKKLQSLAGEWEGKDDHDMVVRTNFQVMASKPRSWKRSRPPGWRRWSRYTASTATASPWSTIAQP